MKHILAGLGFAVISVLAFGCTTGDRSQEVASNSLMDPVQVESVGLSSDEYSLARMKEAGGGIEDPCENLPRRYENLQTIIDGLAAGTREEIIYLEPGCYFGNLTLRSDVPVVLLGAGPDKTILLGRGASGPVVQLIAGMGSVRNLKIKGKNAQDGVWLNGFTSGRQAFVENTLITQTLAAIKVDGPQLSIQNNTIVKNLGNAVRFVTNSPGGAVRNNIIALNKSAAFAFDVPNSGTVDLSDNDIYGNENEGELPAGSYVWDPLFDQHLTYKLSPISPCIGAGSSGQDLGSYGRGNPDVTPPPTPGIFSMSRYSAEIAFLQWRFSEDETTVPRYVVYRSASPQGPFTFLKGVLHPLLDDDPSNDYEYPYLIDYTPVNPWYRVYAVDTAYNVSVASATVSPPTTPALFCVVLAPLCNGDSSTFVWAPSIPNAGYPIMRYTMVANTKNPIHNFNININGTYTSTQKVLPCDTYDITLMAADQQGNFSGVTPIIHFTLGVLAGDTPAQSTIESIPGGDDDPIVNSLLPPICVRAPDGT